MRRLARSDWYGKDQRMKPSDIPEPLRPEDFDDQAWANLLERLEEDATRSHLAERERLIAEGVIDAHGRLLKDP